MTLRQMMRDGVIPTVQPNAWYWIRWADLPQIAHGLGLKPAAAEQSRPATRPPFQTPHNENPPGADPAGSPKHKQPNTIQAEPPGF